MSRNWEKRSWKAVRPHLKQTWFIFLQKPDVLGNKVELQIIKFCFIFLQKPEVLGNKVETQITKLVLENNNILRLGISFEFADARIRVTKKLEDNLDECKIFLWHPACTCTLFIVGV